jgi:hypothetical protein
VVDEHSILGADVQQIARSILAILEPLVQAAATLAPPCDAKTGKCQQVWCPVCAIAAATNGEQHPLAAIVAEHGATLLALIRTMAIHDEPNPPGGGSNGAHHANRPGRYEPITVTVYE